MKIPKKSSKKPNCHRPQFPHPKFPKKIYRTSTLINALSHSQSWRFFFVSHRVPRSKIFEFPRLEYNNDCTISITMALHLSNKHTYSITIRFTYHTLRHMEWQMNEHCWLKSDDPLVNRLYRSPSIVNRHCLKIHSIRSSRRWRSMHRVLCSKSFHYLSSFSLRWTAPAGKPSSDNSASYYDCHLLLLSCYDWQSMDSTE